MAGLRLLGLLADSLLDRRSRLPPGAHDGVLAAHATVEGALQLCAEGELAHALVLFLGQDDALGGEGLVLHAIKAGGDFADFGVLGVVGLDRHGHGRGSHAVGAVAEGSAVLQTHD